MWNVFWIALGALLLNIHNSFYASVVSSVAVSQLNDSIGDYAMGKAAANGAIIFQIIQYMGWGLIAFGIFMVIKKTYQSIKEETTKNENI